MLKEQFTVEEEGVGETVEEVLRTLHQTSLKFNQFLYLSMNGIIELIIVDSFGSIENKIVNDDGKNECEVIGETFHIILNCWTKWN